MASWISRWGNGSLKRMAPVNNAPIHKQGNVVHCGPAVFACFKNKHLAISITPMALSVTMDFAPCSNAWRFTALCVHFVLFPMGFTSPCAKQRKKKRLEAIC